MTTTQYLHHLDADLAFAFVFFVGFALLFLLVVGLMCLFSPALRQEIKRDLFGEDKTP